MSGRVPDHVAGIVPYEPGLPAAELERNLGIRGLVLLASNENPLGPSPRAIQAMKDVLQGSHRYPDGGGYYLRKGLSEKYRLSMERIILGNGSTEIVELLARAFLGGRNSAVVSDHSFLMYRMAVQAVNGNIVTVPMRDFRNDLPAMARAVTPDTRLVFMANPNNPTGTYNTDTEVRQFLERIPEHCLVVVDEAYREYADAPDYPDSLPFLEGGPEIILLRTFSKVYGLAGIRLGYGLSGKEIISTLERVRSPYNTSAVAQAAGLAALGDRDHLRKSVELNRKEKVFLAGELARRSISTLPTEANFLMVEVPGRTGEEVYRELLSLGILVRPLAPYDLPSWVRVAIGTRRENLLFLAGLDRIDRGRG